MKEPRTKAIDFLRRDSAQEPHEPTLLAMLQIARNSHEDRGFRGSPEAKLLTRILTLRRLIALNAPHIVIESSKRLVTYSVGVLVGVDPVGFKLPTYNLRVIDPEKEQELSPAEMEAALQETVRDMQEQGLVDADGYFIDNPN